MTKTDTTTVYFSDFSIDHTGTNRSGISLNHIPSGKKQNLSHTEYGVLMELVSGNGEVVTRTQILKKIWGDDGYFQWRCMDVVLSKLRKCLKPDEKVKIINAHGYGHKLQILP